jgi:hypothetical protein
MSNSISTLLLRNLSDVFGENDPVRRRAAIDNGRLAICVFLAVASVAFGAPIYCYGQKPEPAATDHIRFAQEFLRAFYPDLNGKQYTLSVKTVLQYDNLGSTPDYLLVYVGAGIEFRPISCCLGGFASAPPPPWPPNLGPPPPISPMPQHRSVNTDRIEYDSQGYGYAKQYLTTAFFFKKDGRFDGFSAEGPATANRDTDNKLYELIKTRPGMTREEVVAELKRCGVKYGPDDKEQFVKDLPLGALERFIGKVELISVSFSPLEEDRSNIGRWPDWRVRACAAGDDGASKLEYQILFDPFKADLISLGVVSADERKPGEAGPCR